MLPCLQMAFLGKRNTLRILRSFRHGFYLGGEQLGDILLPTNQVPKDATLGGTVDVFIYRDSEDRLIAATKQPHAMVGEFACLQVVGVDERMGAFLDWGLPKDLLLPIREQTRRLRRGDWILVYVMVDELSGRIVASMRLNRHLNLTEPSYREDEKVNLIVIGETELGYSVIIEGAHRGLLYHSDLRIRLYEGQKLDGYIRKVREDGKVDVALDAAGYSRVAPLAEQIHGKIVAAGGRLAFSDESSPEAIRTAFGCSKKAFKQAIGTLFKQRRIIMLDGGIGLPIDKE
jgi:predicted RNA-binding protein (virulence factor B family)